MSNPPNPSSSTSTRKLKLIYLIGRYPELTTTFIDRELRILGQFADLDLQTMSIRHPLTMAATLPEYQEIIKKTIYLTPINWLTLIIAHLYFLTRRPLLCLQTLFYLLSHEHPDLKTRLMTILHFGLGLYTAYLLRQRPFDHIHVHFIDRSVVIALIVGRLLGKSYSLTAHANSIFVKKILIREKIANAKFMVTVSKHNKSYLLKNYPGLPADKIHILHPWVDLDHFTPPASRPIHDKLHLYSVGRLVEKKGHVDLIEACHSLKQAGLAFECRLAGDGPLHAELAGRIKRYGLQDSVLLQGGQPQQEVIRHLAEWADIFVLPCVIAKDGDRDGIPVSLAEAMAMELPVISTDIVGIGELVQPGSGLLVPPHDPAALAQAITALQATEPAARREMGRCGRAVVEADFNLPRGTAELAAIFRNEVAA
jgi:glycosyltransferase involved in cell wall biosynthesis